MTLNKEQTLPKAKILTETETRLKKTILDLEARISDLEDQILDSDENVGYLYTQIAELGG